MTVADRPPTGLRIDDRKSDVLARGAVSRFVVLLATGLASGAFGAARTGHLLGGAVQALLSGAAYGVAATYVTSSQLRHLRALTRAERLQVVRLVRRGAAPEDPRLASAQLDYVTHLRRSGMTSGPMGLLIVLAVGLLALAKLTDAPLVLAAEGGIVGAWQSLMPPLRASRRNARWSTLEFAERNARHVLGRPDERAPGRRMSPARASVIAALTLVTAVVVVAQAVDDVQSLPRPGPGAGPDEINRNPVADGFTRVTVVGGTTIWLREDLRPEAGFPTLKVRATGRIAEACTVGVASSEPAPSADVYDDVCAAAERRHGTVIVFLRPTDLPEAPMYFDAGGSMSHESAAIDLDRRGYPGLQLLLYVAPDREGSGHRI